MSGPNEGGLLVDDAALDERLLEALGKAAAALTGFSREAILTESLRKSARELLAMWPLEELLSRIHMRDPQVSHALQLAVSVGETFFFRQPEHFTFMLESLVPAWLASGKRRARVWSAGCATGEEPFSVAAYLLHILAPTPQLQLEVLGTDLLTRNLSVARAATYGAWSQRPSAPMLAPLITALEPLPGVPPQVRILDKVRAVVRFQEHNLLEKSPEPEPFDLILCRNVLVYFAPDAARKAIANLCAALAPGGVLMLGSMDLNVAAPDLRREGRPESLIFRKPGTSQHALPALGALGAGSSSGSSQGTPRAPSRSTLPAFTSAPRHPGGISPQVNRVTIPVERDASDPSLPIARPLAGLQPERAPAPGADRSASSAGLPRSNAGQQSSSGAAKTAPGSPAFEAQTLPEPISLHLRALLQIESNELEAAERSLRTLLLASPGYLPGLFERALLHLRRGEPAATTALMREVHKRASALPPEHRVDGPETLEARFYVESAEAYLRGGRG